ncbi:hypothetical protein GCM10010472_38520 [Pseudonocardia halophobica]
MEDAATAMRPAETDSGAVAEPRRCAFRRCREPLPVLVGRGNRPRYCQDGRSWGTKGLSCKDAEAAFVAVESLREEGDTAGAVTAVDDLGARLAAAAGPLAAVLDGVAVLRTQLDDEVREALAARDAALARSAEDHGARLAAEERAVRAESMAAEAGARAAEAVELRTEAERARTRAEQAAAAAEREQLRAEGRSVALEDRAVRAEDLAEAAAAQTAQLRDELAALRATLTARDTELDTERRRAREAAEAHRTELAARRTELDAERQRAREAAVTHRDELDTALAGLREEHASRLDAVRAAAAEERDRTAARHRTEQDRLREEHAAAIDRRAAEHAREAADLHRRLGAAEHELERLRAAADPGEG